MRIFTKRKLRNGLLSVPLILSLLSANAYAQTKAGNVINNRRGEAKSIALPEGSNYRPGDAQTLFSQYLEMDPSTDKLVLAKTTTANKGVSVDRYWQYYKGIKIDRSAYTVFSKDGKVKFLTGNFYKTDANMSTTPALTEQQALAKALEYTHADLYMWQDPMEEQAFKQMMEDPLATYQPKGTIVFVEQFTPKGWDGKLHLAYSFDIYAKKPLSRNIIYVDAATGEILHKNPQIKHTVATGASRYSGTVPMMTGFVGGQYVLHDSTRGNGIFTYNSNNTTSYALTNFTNALIPWATTEEAIDAHWGAEIVYDYWQTQGRNSYDDANARIRSFVHYDVNYNNAFWDGLRMTYGDGTGTVNGGFDPLTSLDVCAHEIGHAVCTYTADLDYVWESGAMNEGLSDIWGAVIENWGNPFESDGEAKAMWRVGEEISNTQLRTMSNPPANGDPDTYDGNFWIPFDGICDDNSDYCGVHSNSGVMNKWFYILTVGETGTNDNGQNYNVTGVGVNTAALIAYQMEMALVNNSEFADARVASINVASALYGPCSPEVQAVTNAWYAVGVGTAFVPCFPYVGFASNTTNITEWNNTIVCPSSRTVNIPVSVTSAPSGGNATVTVTALSGNAVAGQDYTITTGNLTFPASSTATQNAVLTIFDNGAINDDKYVTLQLAITPNGSNLALNTLLDTIRVNITNQDNAPMASSTSTVDLFASNTTSNASSPFQSAYRNLRIQYLMTASELTAAGLVQGVPITSLAFNVQTKNSTIPFNGFTVSMANTAATSIATGTFANTGFTQVYNGNYATVAGWNTIPFSSNFTWTGGSVLINICYSNATNIGQNDICEGYQFGLLTVYNRNTSTPAGCTITASNNSSSARPIMRFTQVTPGTVIETTNASTRTWNVRQNTEVYFYSTADSQAIAGIRNMNNDLGCVAANLSAAGNGFAPASFGGVNRSLKQFNITPAINGSTTSYIATVFMTPTELNGANPTTLFLVKTNEATDATINASNSVIVTPTVSTNSTWTSFEGSFTGFGRYFLTDGPLPPPVPVITPASTTTFCAGGSVLLNGNTGSGISYSWLLNGGLISGATASSFTAMASGTYNFIMTNSVGVADTSAGVTVTVNPGPPATTTPTGNTSICSGSSVNLVGNTGTGYTYQWYMGGSPITGATSSSYSVNAAGTYNMEVTASGCSTLSPNVVVSVNALPAANAGSDLSVCTNSTINLTAVTLAGVTYSWAGPNGFSSNLQNPSIPNAQSFNQGTYTLTVTNTTTNCVGTDQVFVSTTLGTAPAQPGAISGLNTMCSGTTETFSVPTVTGATSYTWTLPNGWQGTSTTNSIDVTPNVNTGTISVVANNACGAGPAQTMVVSINTTPNTPFVVGSIVYCQGETPAQLEATGTNILWYNTLTGGVGSPIAPTPSTATPGMTTYYVSQNDGICESQRSIILVNINPTPVVNILQAGNTLTADGIYPFYQWFLDGIAIPGATSQVYVAAGNGVYTVEVLDPASCDDMSDPITINSFPTSVHGIPVKNATLYPNPTTGICWLELPQVSASTDVSITDVAGKVVYKNTVKDQSKIAFDLSKVAKGVYMVKVVTATKTYTERVTLH